MLLNGHLSRHGYTIENRKPHAAISLCVVTRRPVRVCVCGCVWYMCEGVCGVRVYVCECKD